jgi:hyperosmotically inducible protein
VLTNIRVRSKGGTVTLTGSVPAAALVDQASAVTASVNGVTSVTNHLTVRIDPRTFNRQ